MKLNIDNSTKGRFVNKMTLLTDWDLGDLLLFGSNNKIYIFGR